MSLTPNFSVSQDLGDVSLVTLTDTSTGSDGTITSRRVFFRKSDGTYLVESGTTTDYELWDINHSSESFDILNDDKALDITVKWYAGSSVVYEKTILNLLKPYGETFLYNLTQYQTTNPEIVNNSTYYRNKIKLRTLLDDAVQAVSIANDQTSAQRCLDLSKKLMLKELRLN